MKLGYQTQPSRRLGCWPVFSAAVLLTFIFSGCAASVEGQLPTVELSVRALPPVGGTIPVLVSRRCTANCGSTSSPLTRQQVAALNESGLYVQAIPPDDAAKLAGGTEKLLDALNARESHAVTIARESTFEAQNASSGIFAVLAVPFALAGAASSATQPAETIEKMRLAEVAIPECPPSLEAAHGCPIRSDISHLHHDPAMGGDGWVFFPTGKYTEVKASYDWSPSIFTGEENRTEIITAPWNGSSTSPSTPLPSESQPSERS